MSFARRAAKQLAIVGFVFVTLYLFLFVVAFTIDLFVPGRADAHFRDILALTEKPLDLSEAPPEFAKTATLMGLSQAAIGLLNLEFSSDDEIAPRSVRAAVSRRLVELASDPKLRFADQPSRGVPEHGFGIYFSHRLFVLCTNRIVTSDTTYDDEIDTTVRYLEMESKREGFHGIAQPYSPTLEGLFPADQSMVILSLLVCGRARETFGGVATLEHFLREQETHPLFEAKKIHTSGWNYKYSAIPRGVGLGYELSNLSRFEGTRFRDLYEKHKSEFLVNIGPFAAFREWPRGSDEKSDLDSGPVLFGIGAAATALSLQAAKLQQDEDVANSTERLGAFVGFPFRMNGGSTISHVDHGARSRGVDSVENTFRSRQIDGLLRSRDPLRQRNDDGDTLAARRSESVIYLRSCLLPPWQSGETKPSAPPSFHSAGVSVL